MSAVSASQAESVADSGRIEIRPLYAPDLKHGFLETLESLTGVGLTYEQAVTVFQQRLRDHIETYVAVIDNQVVGTATLMIETKFIHSGGRCGHIEDVAVHKDHQQKGLGSQLLRHLLGLCESRGCYKVILDCAPHLVEYYKKLGFREWAHGMRIDVGSGH